jgi:hypothetical protein
MSFPQRGRRMPSRVPGAARISRAEWEGSGLAFARTKGETVVLQSAARVSTANLGQNFVAWHARSAKSKNFSGDSNLHAGGNVMDQETHPIIDKAASPIRDRRRRLTARDPPAY